MDATGWTAVFAALAAAAAIAYTAITYFLFREAQRQTEGQIAPVLTVAFKWVSGSVAIENVGKGVAVNGTLTVTIEKDPDPNMAEHFTSADKPFRWSEALPILGPGQTYSVGLDKEPVRKTYGPNRDVCQYFRFTFRIECESTSGGRYFTEAHAEKANLVQDSLSYGRVR